MTVLADPDTMPGGQYCLAQLLLTVSSLPCFACFTSCSISCCRFSAAAMSALAFSMSFTSCSTATARTGSAVGTLVPVAAGVTVKSTAVRADLTGCYDMQQLIGCR